MESGSEEGVHHREEEQRSRHGVEGIGVDRAHRIAIKLSPGEEV
jgi:hypothetical protein